jgi:hypothetical protein
LSYSLVGLYEVILSKFTGSIDAAWHGGSISQVGPYIWVFTNLAKTFDTPDDPPIAIPGTKVSPWRPECDELRDKKNAAKDAAKGKECSEGLHPFQLQRRYELWMTLALARQAYNAACWNGGDIGHQDAADTAFEEAQVCAELKEKF